jgi:hypothetical protein
MENRISNFARPSGDGWPFDASRAEHQAQIPVVQNVGAADVYAAAWTLAQRDYELDKLFNASFYYEI